MLRRAQAKDRRSKGAEGQTSVNMVHQPQIHGKGKATQNQNNSKSKQTTTFNKKKNNEYEGYFVCGSSDHWAKK
jgi:hypothetical protein